MRRIAPIYRRVGKAIRDVRLKANLSQQDLANLCSLGRTSIVNIEAGRQAAQLDTIEEIALALHVTVASLVDSPSLRQRIQDRVPGQLSEAQMDAVMALLEED